MQNLPRWLKYVVNKLRTDSLNTTSPHIRQPVSTLEHTPERFPDFTVAMPGLQLPPSPAEEGTTERNALIDTAPRLRLPQQTPHPNQLLQMLYPLLFGGEDLPTVPLVSTDPVAAVTVPRRALYLDIGVGWHTGTVRSHLQNEDNLLALQNICTSRQRLIPFGLFIIADGMGGHAFGWQASHLAVQTMAHAVLQYMLESDELHEETLIETLLNGVYEANNAVCLFGQGKEQEVGTTLTVALVIESRAYIVNVGDSRVYLYREDEGLCQITRDHSLVAKLVEAGVITPDEVYTHPQRHKVYSSLGDSTGVDADWFIKDLNLHDYLLLCSDGLWEMVRDPAIEQILKSGSDTKQISDMLVQAALNNGGADNVSAIVVRVPSI